MHQIIRRPDRTLILSGPVLEYFNRRPIDAARLAAIAGPQHVPDTLPPNVCRLPAAEAAA